MPTALQGSKCVRRELKRRKYQVKARYQIRASALLLRSDDAAVQVHRRGRCPPPCNASEPAPMLSDELSLAERTEWAAHHPPLPQRTPRRWLELLSRPWSSARDRAATLDEWRRLVRSELDAGWLGARSCRRRAAAVRGDRQGCYIYTYIHDIIYGYICIHIYIYIHDIYVI